MPFGFWEKLPQPFFCLAPLANVTDAAFRYLIAKYGKPDVFYTEFVSCDGLVSGGRDVLLRDLAFSSTEHPIVAQLFGSNPDHFVRCAELVQSLGFDGLDVNMGCPDRNVEKQGAGAALMKHPRLAREIIRAAKAGAGNLPVSVKTRIGYAANTIDAWLPELLTEGLSAIAIHARTRREMSGVDARWDVVARAVDIARGSGTLIIGNGDVRDLSEANAKAAETGANGVMLGRAIFGNPWLFKQATSYGGRYLPTVEEKLRVMAEHTALFEQLLGDIKSFNSMKKHYRAYVTGFDGARELRAQLVGAKDASEVALITAGFLKQASFNFEKRS
jgi:nifR3 family TIM-barrel protein